MPIQKLPRTGLYSDLKTGSSGWGPQRNYNSNRSDQLISAAIIDELADYTLLPPIPAPGDTYFIQDTMKLATFILGSWFQDFTPLGLPIYNITLDSFFYFDGAILQPFGGGGGTGDVVGPGSAVDSNIVLFDTGTGKLIKDSGVALSSFPAVTTDFATSYNFTWNGGGGSAGLIIPQVSKIGRNLTLTFPNAVAATTGTSSTQLVSATGLPVFARPITNPLQFIVPGIDNGANSPVITTLEIATSGVMTIEFWTGAAFIDGTSAGMATTSVSYIV